MDGLGHFDGAWAKVKELSTILPGPIVTKTCLDADLHDHASTEKATSRFVQRSVADAREEEGLESREMLEVECEKHSFSNTAIGGVVSIGASLAQMLAKEFQGLDDITPDLQTRPPCLCGPIADNDPAPAMPVLLL